MPSHPTISNWGKDAASKKPSPVLKLGKVTALKKPSIVLKLGKVIAKDGTLPTGASAIPATTDAPAIPAASGIPVNSAAQVTPAVLESGALAKKTVLEDDSESPLAPPVDETSPVIEKDHHDMFAPSTDPSDPFEPERLRIKLALLQWRAKWDNPRTRSSASWAAEKDKYAKYSDRADDVNEKQYWMARSIKAGMNAQGRYKAGRKSDKNIRLGVHMWKRSFLNRQKGGDGETIFGDFGTAEETIKAVLQLRKDSEEDEDLSGPDLSYSAAIFDLPLFAQFDLHDAATIAGMATGTEAAAAATDPAIAAAKDVKETPKPSDLGDFARNAITGALVPSKKRKAEVVDLTADSPPPPISKDPYLEVEVADLTADSPSHPYLEAFVKKAILGTKPFAKKPLATKPPSDESGPSAKKRQKTEKDK